MARITSKAARLRIVPANSVSWDDLRASVGAARSFDSLCFCQRFKILKGWHSVGQEERAHRLRTQAECGYPDSDTTSGLVGYLDDEPVAWCAVEPRTAYIRLTRQVTWAGRNEDKTDEGVWAITCLITRTPHRWQGFTYQIRSAFAAAGFGEVTRPTRRRVVMRIDL